MSASIVAAASTEREDVLIGKIDTVAEVFALGQVGQMQRLHLLHLFGIQPQPGLQPVQFREQAAILLRHRFGE
jgi:hypothetical protein